MPPTIVFRWYDQFSSGGEWFNGEQRSRPKGFYTKNVCPPRSTVNIEFYKNRFCSLLLKFCARLARFTERSSFLLHDNSPAHTVPIVTHFLNRKMVLVIAHSDLSSLVFIGYIEVKNGAQDGRLKSPLTQFKEPLPRIPKTDLSRSMEKSRDRASWT